MKLIDTHAHLYSSKFDSDREEMLSRAQNVLSHVMLPNIDLDSIEGMHGLCDAHPDFCFPMMGLHPCSVDGEWKSTLAQMEPHFAQRRYYGVGETGLDYYWDKTFVTEQKDALRVQAVWAKDLDLPLILHCRDSMDDVIDIVREAQDGRLRGIFHCFTGTVEQARQIMDLGFLMGIGGVVTYKNSDLGETLKAVGADLLVLETDSPYLPPVPHRGKRNESGYVPLIASKLAEVFDTTAGEIARVTSTNALDVFGLDS